MQMLNRYFAPFALILILSAIQFSEPDPKVYRISLAILAASLIINWIISANVYRFFKWTRALKALLVWLDYLWAVPLVWLLLPYWGPMWLLFVMAPVTAALYWNRWQTLGISLVSAGTLLAIYAQRGVFEGGGPAMGMSFVHAAFIVVFALFIHGLAQTALRMRDAN
jgi:hypothetical protein